MTQWIERIDMQLARLASGSGIGPMLFVALFAFVVFLPTMTTLPPVDRDETRFSQASRQMVESGDFIDIQLGEGKRYKKPVGIYWLQSVSLAVFGTDNATEIWVYRVPSLLAAVAACVFTYLIALALAGPQAGLVAGMLMACTIVLGGEARIAKTDATLLLTVVIAQWALVRAVFDDVAPKWAWWVFWSALGASMLVKGPIGPMVIGLTVVGWSLIRREMRWLAPLRPGLGVLLFLAISVPWYVAILIVSDGAFWAESVGKDMVAKIGEGQESHGAPAGTYAAAVWLTFWPAAILLPFGLWHAWLARGERVVQFLLVWIIPTWLVFEFTATKLIHYVLPTYPALAVLCAAGLLALPDGRLSLRYRIYLVAALALALLLVAVPVGYTIPLGMGPTVVWACGVALVVAGAFWVWLAMQVEARFAAVAGFAALAIGVFVALFGHLSRFDYLWPANWIAQTYAAEEAHAVCEGMRLVSLGFREESLMLLTAELPVRTTDAATAAEAVKAAPCAVAFVNAPLAADFDAATIGLERSEIGRFEGLSIGGNDKMNITAYRFD